MATFVQVNGRVGTSSMMSVLYIDPATVMVVTTSSHDDCIVTTTTTQEWTVAMPAADFINLIGGTVTPSP